MSLLMESIEKRGRPVKMATTYLRKASHMLWSGSVGKLEPAQFLQNEYWSLLEQAIETACDIVEALPEEFFVDDEVTDYFGLTAALGASGKYNRSDDSFEKARELVALIEKRRSTGVTLRRIMALEENGGRTTEEAEAHLAHARKLRAQLGRA